MSSSHYHCSVKSIGKGKGLAASAYRYGGRAKGGGRGAKSAVAAAAYRCGEKMRDGDQIYDYSNRADSVHETIIETPKVAPIWSHDAEKLWNAAEHDTERHNGRVATELELALPHQLNYEQRRELVVNYVRENFVDKYGVAAQINLHSAKDNDHQNEHAHVMLSHRELGSNGFGDIANRHMANKKIEGQYREVEVAGIAATSRDTRQIREDWANACNQALERAGREERVDHRTLREQGILDRKPQQHLGPTLSRAIREHHGPDRDPPSVAPQQRRDHERDSLDQAHEARHPEPVAPDRDPPTPAAQLRETAERYWAELAVQAQPQHQPAGFGSYGERLRAEHQAKADRLYDPKFGERDLRVADVAKEISPDYRKWSAETDELKRQIWGKEQQIERNVARVEAAESALAQQWQAMGAIRRTAYTVGIDNPERAQLWQQHQQAEE